MSCYRWITPFLTFIWLMASPAAEAQNLNAIQKIQYTAAAVEGANDELRKGEVAHARLLLLGVLMAVRDIAPAAGVNPEVGDVINGYMDARNRAWEEGPGLDPASFQHFLDVYGAAEADYQILAKQNYFDVLPHGKREYRRHITEMVAGQDFAWDRLADLCMAAPPPDLLVSDPGALQQIHQRGIPKLFYYVTFGGVTGTMLAQQRVIPETLEAVTVALDSASAKQIADDVWWNLAEAEEGLGILNTLEAVLREEPEVDLGSLRQDLKSLRVRADAENKRAEKLKNAEIDANRVPPDQWKGGGRDAVLSQVRSAYSGVEPKSQILRVSLMQEGFGERWESWWQDDVLHTVYSGYVMAAVAVRAPDGEHWVAIRWFRRTRTADGGWSTIVADASIQNYRIRSANVER